MSSNDGERKLCAMPDCEELATLIVDDHYVCSLHARSFDDTADLTPPLRVTLRYDGAGNRVSVSVEDWRKYSIGTVLELRKEADGMPSFHMPGLPEHGTKE